MTFRYRVPTACEAAGPSAAPAPAAAPEPHGLPAKSAKCRTPWRAAIRKATSSHQSLAYVLPISFVLACIVSYTVSTRSSIQDSLSDALRAAATGLRSDQESRSLVMDRYLEAMSNPKEYIDSDFPFTAEVQEALHRHQRPTSCRDANFLIYYVWSHGFGSFARGMSAALAMAVSTDRVLLLAAGPPPKYRTQSGARQVWSTWNHGVGCEREHPECFFQPVSGCSLERVHELMERDEISYVELEEDATVASLPPAGPESPRVVVARGKLGWLAAFRRDLPVAAAMKNLRVSDATRQNAYFASENKYVRNRMWALQGMVYLLRLNERMQALVRPALENCFKTDAPDLDRIIGLPIRGSDKCYHKVSGRREGEADCVSLSATLSLAARIHAAQPWVDTVLVTSEDRRVLASARSLPEMALGSDKDRRWTLLTNDGDVQQGTGRSIGRVAGGGGNTTSPTPARITESILTTLACQVLPSHHIVLMKSNFGDVIDLLSKAVPGRLSGTTLNSGAPVYPS